MEFTLRNVNIEDIDLLFEWRNDVSVRLNSFNQRKLNYSEHKIWLEQILQQKNVNFYILMSAHKPVGQIRIDFNKNIGRINYSIDKLERKKGYGKRILYLAEQKILREIRKEIILEGLVKIENISSQKAFKSLKYIEEKETDYYRYTKKLM